MLKKKLQTIKVRIPVPHNIQNLKAKSVEVSEYKKSPQHSDAEVIRQIKRLCQTTNNENNNNIDIDPKIQAKTLNRDKKEDLSYQIDALADRLNNLKHSKYLPLEFTTTVKDGTPYDYLAKASIGQEKKRLSVTKIIPYRYCELKSMYEVYLGFEMHRSEAMKRGVEIHRTMEINDHPQRPILVESANQESRSLVDVDAEELQPADRSTRQTRRKMVDQTLKRMSRLNNQNVVTLQDPELSDDISVKNPETSFIKDEGKYNQEKDRESWINTTLKDAKTNGERGEAVDKNSIFADIEKAQMVAGTSRRTDELNSKMTLITEAIDKGFQIIPKIRLKGEKEPSGSDAFKLTQTLIRYLQLFRKGTCHEVLVHGFYNPHIEDLIIPSNKKQLIEDDKITISGVIDQLKLQSVQEGAFPLFQKEISEKLEGTETFEQLIKTIEDITRSWVSEQDPMIELVINDDKTRMFNARPTRIVQQQNLVQVGMYAKLLGLLTNNVDFTYHSWLCNMKDRGNEVFEPLSNDVVSFCSICSDLLFNDFLRLKNGEMIDYSDIVDGPYSASGMTKFIYENTTDDTSLDILAGEWIYPPTLAHITARLSQVQLLVKPFFHKKIEVTYLFADPKNSGKLKVIDVSQNQYDEEFINEQIHLGMDLWMGRREPAGPLMPQACKNCEFNHKCQIPLKRQGLL